MGIREARVWTITCDICRRHHSTVISNDAPSVPKGWGGRTLHDCGLTGYTRNEVLCDWCLEKWNDRVSVDTTKE